jgi:hypothetical protein
MRLDGEWLRAMGWAIGVLVLMWTGLLMAFGLM